MTTPENQPPDIQVLTSNLCMPPAALFLGSPEVYQKHAEIIGVDGYEITPVRSRFVHGALNAAEIMKAGQLKAALDLRPYEVPGKFQVYGELIKSGHAPFREEVVLDQEPLLFRAFPGTEEGLHMLDMFHYVTARKLQHHVLYMRDQDKAADYRGYGNPFIDRSFQPKARDWLGLWGLREDALGQNIAEVMEAHGFDSITWDVFHSQVEGPRGEKFEDPLLMARWLSAQGWVNSVHVSLNRQDCAEPGSKLAQSTKEAQRAFMESTEAALETPEGKMLLDIVRDWDLLDEHRGTKRFVVLEEMPTKTLRSSKIQDRQAAIVDSIRSIVALAR